MKPPRCRTAILTIPTHSPYKPHTNGSQNHSSHRNRIVQNKRGSSLRRARRRTAHPCRGNPPGGEQRAPRARAEHPRGIHCGERHNPQTREQPRGCAPEGADRGPLARRTLSGRHSGHGHTAVPARDRSDRADHPAPGERSREGLCGKQESRGENRPQFLCERRYG